MKKALLFAVFFAFLGIFFARSAAAQTSEAMPPAPPVSEPQIQLFRAAANEERSARRLDAALSVGMGAVGVGAGAILINDDNKATYPYVLTIAGGVRIVTSVNGVLTTEGPYEQLAESVQGWRASGITGPELALRTDKKWFELANSAHRSRVRRGIVGLVVGGIFAVVAVVLAADTSLDVDADTRARAAGGYIAAGAATLAGGVRTLLVRDPIEVGYETSRAAGGIPVAKGVSLTPSGAGGGLLVQF